MTSNVTLLDQIRAVAERRAGKAACGRPREGRGRYCRQCHACYMRQWRRTRITVSRDAWERLTEGRGA